jgi:hypothetical protein
MQSIAIVLMCVLAAVAYGVAHDQVTARVCVEYFTVGHPPVFETVNPTLLGLGWGVIATWWVGLLLGIPLAAVARAGSRPKRTVGSLVRPVAWLLVVTAVCALITGLAGWLLAQSQTNFRPTGTHCSWPTCGRTPPATSLDLSAGSWCSCGYGGRGADRRSAEPRRPHVPPQSRVPVALC